MINRSSDHTAARSNLVDASIPYCIHTFKDDQLTDYQYIWLTFDSNGKDRAVSNCGKRCRATLPLIMFGGILLFYNLYPHYVPRSFRRPTIAGRDICHGCAHNGTSHYTHRYIGHQLTLNAIWRYGCGTYSYHFLKKWRYFLVTASSYRVYSTLSLGKLCNILLVRGVLLCWVNADLESQRVVFA